MPSVIIALMFLAGMGLAWRLYGMVGDELAFEHKSQVAEGRVVALQERPSSGKFEGSVYAPVFRYATATGRIVDVVGSDGSDPPVWKIGQTSRLLYDPAMPLHATADTLWARWGSSLLFAIVTLSFFAAGTLGLRTRGWRLTGR